MKNIWVKLALFLVPALAALAFLFSWLAPEKKVIRRADAIFATVQRNALSRGDADEKAARFNDLVEPSFEITGPDPVPKGAITRADATRLLLEFHESILSCEVAREQASVAFPSKWEARLECPVTVTVNYGGGMKDVRRFTCQMAFRRSSGSWLLARLALTPVGP